MFAARERTSNVYSYCTLYCNAIMWSPSAARTEGDTSQQMVRTKLIIQVKLASSFLPREIAPYLPSQRAIPSLAAFSEILSREPGSFLDPELSVSAFLLVLLRHAPLLDA